MPKVSICIPTCNRRDYLAQTLESVFSQTYKDFEVVVVDDGSTDGTQEMLDKCGHPIRCFRQDNQGEPASRNKLIELAQSEYITFIDSDDLLFPYAIEDLMSLIESNGPDTIAYGTYVRIDENGGPIKRKQHDLPAGHVAVDLFERIFVHSCGTLCRRQLLKDAGGFDVSLPVCSPYALWLELSLGHDFYPASRPMFKRRRHSGNMSAYVFENRMIELNVLERAYKNGFSESLRAPEMSRRALRRLGKEGYRAARCAIREGKQREALELLEQSFRRHRSFKTLLWWVVARLGRGNSRA